MDEICLVFVLFCFVFGGHTNHMLKKITLCLNKHFFSVDCRITLLFVMIFRTNSSIYEYSYVEYKDFPGNSSHLLLKHISVWLK